MQNGIVRYIIEGKQLSHMTFYRCAHGGSIVAHISNSGEAVKPIVPNAAVPL